MMQIDGQCHCGRIRYRAEVDPEQVGICHCTDCQTLTGTAFRVTVRTRREHLAVEGETKIYVKNGDSGRRRFQHFCPNCGSHLFVHGEGADADRWGIRWGGINQRAALIPRRQIWRRSAAPWVCAFDEAPAKPEE
jgi:hypothetical protein